MGPTALLPFGRKSYSGFLRSEKIHRPRPGLNQRTSDSVARMITTGPPVTPKMDLRGVGCDPGYWIALAEDRDQLQAYVSAVMNLRVP